MRPTTVEQDPCTLTRGAPLLDGFLHAGFPLSQLREDFKTNRRAILLLLPLLTTRDKERLVEYTRVELATFSLQSYCATIAPIPHNYP